MRYSLKVLGLSALALVSVLAVNASAAQAFTLMRNNTNVSELKIEGKSTEGGHLLVPAIGLNIHCKSAFGTATASGTGTVTATATVEFEGCEVVENPQCTVTIEPAHGHGTLAMNEVGGEDFIIAEPETGKPFTTVFLEGVFCTLPEEEPVTGTARVGLPNPEAELKEHEVTIDDQALKYGIHEAFIDGDSGGPVHGTIHEVSGATFSALLP